MKDANSGLSLPTVIFIVFLVLKLVGVISWPWIWVFSPIWISVVISVILAVIIGVAKGIMGVEDDV